MYSTQYLNTLAFFSISKISERGILLSTDTSTIESFENGHKACQTSIAASYKINQQPTGEKGKREGLESSPPNGVLQNPVGGEQVVGETEASFSPTTCSDPAVNDRETFKIGNRVIDFPYGFRGVVVGFKRSPQ